MIRRTPELEAFERRRLREAYADPVQCLRIYDSMLAYARSIGAFPKKDPLDGLETRIYCTRVLNDRRVVEPGRTDTH
jgi:hypothetical protein